MCHIPLAHSACLEEISGIFILSKYVAVYVVRIENSRIVAPDDLSIANKKLADLDAADGGHAKGLGLDKGDLEVRKVKPRQQYRNLLGL